MATKNRVILTSIEESVKFLIERIGDEVEDSELLEIDEQLRDIVAAYV